MNTQASHPRITTTITTDDRNSPLRVEVETQDCLLLVAAERAIDSISLRIDTPRSVAMSTMPREMAHALAHALLQACAAKVEQLEARHG